MKRLLLAIAILAALLPVADARMTTVVVGGGVSGGACAPAYSATELWTTTGATSDPNGNESDALGSWANNNMASFVSTSDGTPYAGTYHLLATPDASLDYINSAAPGDNGKIYKCTLWAKHTGIGGSFGISMGPQNNTRNNNVGLIPATDTTYTEHTIWYQKSDNFDFLFIGALNYSSGQAIYLDNISCVEQTTQCLGNELFTASDASSLSNEANSAASWTAVGTAAVAAITDPADGTYAIQMTAGGTNADKAYLDLNSYMTSGHKYFITWKAKLGSGSEAANVRLDLTTTLGTSSYLTSPISSTYVQQGYFCLYDGSNCRYLGLIESGASNNSVAIFDSLSIKEVLDE